MQDPRRVMVVLVSATFIFIILSLAAGRLPS